MLENKKKQDRDEQQKTPRIFINDKMLKIS